MIKNIRQIKPGDKLLISSKHGLGLKIQPFQMRTDPESGVYNHSADPWNINGELCVSEQTQAPRQRIKANENLTLFRDYLESDSDLLLLSFKYDIKALGWFKPWQRIMIAENGKLYDFHNLFKFQIVRTVFGWWTGGKKNRDKRTVCHESAMWKTRCLGKLMGEDWFPEYYKARVSDLYHSELFTHKLIDKKALLESISKR